MSEIISSNAKYNPSKIYFIQLGEVKPPVLFLHGWGSNPESLLGIAKPISEHRKIISLALPGFSKSVEPEEPWGSYDYVEVLHDWLVDNKIKKVDLVGHSFGGRVSIGFINRYPDMVGRLVLIGSAGLNIPRSLQTQSKILYAKTLNNLYKVGWKSLREWIDRKRKNLGSADWKAASPIMKKTMSTVIREDLTKELKLIKSSVLLIWGENDTAVPISIGRKMAGLIDQSRLVSLKNAGHYCFIENKGDVLSEIWDFLDLPNVW